MSKDTEKSNSSPESSNLVPENPTIPGCLSQAERLLQAVNNYTGIALSLAVEEDKAGVSPDAINEIYQDMQDIAGRLARLICSIAKTKIRNKK